MGADERFLDNIDRWNRYKQERTVDRDPQSRRSAETWIVARAMCEIEEAEHLAHLAGVPITDILGWGTT